QPSPPRPDPGSMVMVMWPSPLPLEVPVMPDHPGRGAFSGPRGGTAFVEATGCGAAQGGQAVKRLAAHRRGKPVSRGSLAAVLAGPGRVREGQLLDEVQDAAGQDGDQAGHAGHYLARWSPRQALDQRPASPGQ